jgi:hypothetical protein
MSLFPVRLHRGSELAQFGAIHEYEMTRSWRVGLDDRPCVPGRQEFPTRGTEVGTVMPSRLIRGVNDIAGY